MYIQGNVYQQPHQLYNVHIVHIVYIQGNVYQKPHQLNNVHIVCIFRAMYTRNPINLTIFILYILSIFREMYCNASNPITSKMCIYCTCCICSGQCIPATPSTVKCSYYTYCIYSELKTLEWNIQISRRIINIQFKYCLFSTWI